MNRPPEQIGRILPGYEKIVCKPCAGTGRVSKGAGFYSWKSDRRRRPNCPACGGAGYTVVRIAPAERVFR